MKATKIHYRKEAGPGFYNTLQKRVDEFLSNKETTTSYFPAVKAAVLLSMYIYFLSLIFIAHHTPVIITSYIMLGALTTGIFLNVVHDAAHNALFKNPSLNKRTVLLLEAFGTDAYIWKRRHITVHHSYPNIINVDCDIRQSNLVRVLPNSAFRFHHRFQPYYMPFIYFFYTLNWLFYRDMTDAFIHADELRVSKLRKVKLVLQKMIYLFVFIVLPAMLSGKSMGIYLTGFMLMHFTASIIGVMALTTAHVNHDSEFPEPDENGMMPDSWAAHQLRVTQDFATDNSVINACFGGFNFHVAHHLFPSVQHRHYKKITGIIRTTAEEFGLEYKFKSLGAALVSHYMLLISNSHRPPQIDM